MAARKFSFATISVVQKKIYFKKIISDFLSSYDINCVKLCYHLLEVRTATTLISIMIDDSVFGYVLL